MKMLWFLALLILFNISSVVKAETPWVVYGSVASTESSDLNCIDADGLTGTEMQYATVYSRYGEGSNLKWIIKDGGGNTQILRFRVSNPSAVFHVQIFGLAGESDAEHLFDVNDAGDASAMPATLGGYYVNNLDTTGVSLFTGVGKQNSDYAHRMCTIIFSTLSYTRFIVVVKDLSAGTIYWDSFTTYID